LVEGKRLGRRVVLQGSPVHGRVRDWDRVRGRVWYRVRVKVNISARVQVMVRVRIRARMRVGIRDMVGYLFRSG
jgi:hypothetical protein